MGDANTWTHNNLFGKFNSIYFCLYCQRTPYCMLRYELVNMFTISTVHGRWICFHRSSVWYQANSAFGSKIENNCLKLLINGTINDPHNLNMLEHFLFVLWAGTQSCLGHNWMNELDTMTTWANEFCAVCFCVCHSTVQLARIWNYIE